VFSGPFMSQQIVNGFNCILSGNHYIYAWASDTKITTVEIWFQKLKNRNKWKYVDIDPNKCIKMQDTQYFLECS